MADIKDLRAPLDRLLKEIAQRAKLVEKNRQYVRGQSPIPQAVVDARMTRAYQALMGMSAAPWAGLVVDSKQDRLEVGGVRTGDEALDSRLWAEVWQVNGLDAEAKLAQHSVLRDGRAFATVWPDENGVPEVVYDAADQVAVMYIEGRHQQRHRVAAARLWTDTETGVKHVTYYTRTALYKLRAAKDQFDGPDRVQADGTWWEAREELGRDRLPEPWPLFNPYNVVPVIELATNRELQAGPFPYARGEFQHCHGLLDRISLLTFLGLVVAVWMGFPLRYTIGEKIIRDDDGTELPPFTSAPDTIAQLENPNAKIGELKSADRGNLSIFSELAELAYVTVTPAHYFPNSTGFSNISADMIRALEGGMHAKVDGIHKPQIGEGHEEVLRVGGLMLADEIDVPATAEVYWLDKESRSLAERADAAAKLKEILPPEFIAEAYLQLTQEQLGRVRGALAGTALDRLFAAAQERNPEPVAA